MTTPDCPDRGPVRPAAWRRFEAAPQSVPLARHWVLTTASVADEHASERIAAAASELVTNAVVHAGGEIEVEVATGERTLRVTVTDNSPRLPTLAEEGPEAGSVRGLHIVGVVADRWGFDSTPTGKSVWFEVDLPDPV